MPHVMTVSESSKVDIHRDYGVPLDRMHVVPVGVDPDMFKPIPASQRVPGRILCTTSSDVTMKGLAVPVSRRSPSCAPSGRSRSSSSASRARESRTPQIIAQYGLTDIVSFVHGVSDQRIVELYSECDLAVVPSLYEGFSLPGDRGDVVGRSVARDHGRRAARGRGHARRDVLPRASRRQRGHGRDDAHRARRQTLARPRRRRRSSARHRQLELAAHRRRRRSSSIDACSPARG